MEQAIAQFYQGEWEQSIGVMNGLLENPEMELGERSRARKFVALGYILLGRPDEAVEVYKQIVRDDPAFDMDSLTIQGGETPDEAVRYFGQALLEVRREEMRAREAQLSLTSRKGAILRSVVLPGDRGTKATRAAAMSCLGLRQWQQSMPSLRKAPTKQLKTITTRHVPVPTSRIYMTNIPVRQIKPMWLWAYWGQLGCSMLWILCSKDRTLLDRVMDCRFGARWMDLGFV